MKRLSFGIQSFQPALLTTLGRIHGPDDARAAIRAARAAGFDDLNLDLIFAVPGRDPRAIGKPTSPRSCSGRPEHVSAYNLTYEPNTPFHTLRARGELRPLDDEDELWMYQHVRAALAAAGYAQYEISNFAAVGTRGPSQSELLARRRLSRTRGRRPFVRAHAGVGTALVERAHSRALHRCRRRGATRSRAPRSCRSTWPRRSSCSSGSASRHGVDPARVRRPLRAAARRGPSRGRRCFRADGFLEDRAGRLALSERGLLVADSIFARSSVASCRRALTPRRA